MNEAEIKKKLKNNKAAALTEISQKMNLLSNYLIVAKCSYKLSEYEEAEKYLNLCQALIDKGEEVGNIKLEVLYYRAKTEQGLKRYSKAYSLFREVEYKTSLGETTELHNKITYVLYKMRRYYNAMTEASVSMSYAEEEEKKTGEKDFICRYYNLFCLNKYEQYKEALYFAKNDLKEKLDIDDQAVIDNMCWSYYGLGQLTECKDLVNKHLNKYPTLNYYLANIEYDAKNYKAAWNYIEKATAGKKESSDEKYSYFKGLVQNALGNPEEANKWFKDSIRVNYKNLESYIEIAKNYEKQNKMQQALEILNEANKTIDEENEKRYELYFLLIRAQFLYQMDHKEEAIDLIQYVRKILGSGYAEIEIQPSVFLSVLFKYFELYNLGKGYNRNDIQLNISDENYIGYGGFSKVYKGKLKGKDVSIKIFKTKISDEMKFDKLFKSMLNLFHEINTMETLHHKNLLPMETILFNEDGQEGKQLYLITPLCKGGNLCDCLRGKNKKEMSIRTRVKIALQIAEGLNYMHTGIKDTSYIHHDLKSNNVLLVDEFDDNKENNVKICDFGATGKNFAYDSAFTPNWSSPELLMGNTCTNKTDVWSFGATLYELFSNKVPYFDIKEDKLISHICYGNKPNYQCLLPETPELIKKIFNMCFQFQNDRAEMTQIIPLLKQCL